MIRKRLDLSEKRLEGCQALLKSLLCKPSLAETRLDRQDRREIMDLEGLDRLGESVENIFKYGVDLTKVEIRKEFGYRLGGLDGEFHRTVIHDVDRTIERRDRHYGRTMNILDTAKVHLGGRRHLFIPLLNDTGIVKCRYRKNTVHMKFSNTRPFRGKESEIGARGGHS